MEFTFFFKACPSAFCNYLPLPELPIFHIKLDRKKKKLQLYFNTRITVKNTTPPPEQISNNISTIKTKNQTDTNRKTTHNQLYTAQNLIDTQGTERKDSHFCNTKSGSLAVSRAAIYVLLRFGSW